MSFESIQRERFSLKDYLELLSLAGIGLDSVSEDLYWDLRDYELVSLRKTRDYCSEIVSKSDSSVFAFEVFRRLHRWSSPPYEKGVVIRFGDGRTDYRLAQLLLEFS